LCFQLQISGCVGGYAQGCDGGYAQGYDGDDEKAVIEAMNKAIGFLNRSHGKDKYSSILK